MQYQNLNASYVASINKVSFYLVIGWQVSSLLGGLPRTCSHDGNAVNYDVGLFLLTGFNVNPALDK